MGMFDHLYVNREFPLPLPADFPAELTLDHIYAQEFQTKDLDCLLDTYDIAANGTLTKRMTRWVSTPPTGELFDVGGHLEYTGTHEPVPAPYTVTFYMSLDDDALENDYWLEWTISRSSPSARYAITLDRGQIVPNVERKIRDKAFREEQEARHRLFATWWFQPYIWYAHIVRWFFRTYYRLKQYFPSSFKIEHWLTPL